MATKYMRYATLYLLALLIFLIHGLAISCAQAPSERKANLPPFLGEKNEQGDGALPERLALVIGIDYYKGSPALSVPNLSFAAKDATNVADALRRAGFARVIEITTNPERKYVARNDMLNAIARFQGIAAESAKRAGRPPIVLFYFAGHGVSVEGQDYLIPSDFSPDYADDLNEMGLPVEKILDRLSWSKPALRLVLLDACRTSIVRSLPSRGDPERSVRVEPGHVGKQKQEKATGENDLILFYSTLEGHNSYEAASIENGRFTKQLVDALNEFQAAATNDRTGQRTSIAKLHSMIHVGMSGRETQKQIPKMISNATELILFPTDSDYSDENRAWTISQQSNPTNIYKDFSLPLIRGRLFCNMMSFLKKYGYYSYFSYAALRKRNEGLDNECERADLNMLTSPYIRKVFWKYHDDWQQWISDSFNEDRAATFPPLLIRDVVSGLEVTKENLKASKERYEYAARLQYVDQLIEFAKNNPTALIDNLAVTVRKETLEPVVDPSDLRILDKFPERRRLAADRSPLVRIKDKYFRFNGSSFSKLTEPVEVVNVAPNGTLLVHSLSGAEVSVSQNTTFPIRKLMSWITKYGSNELDTDIGYAFDGIRQLENNFILDMVVEYPEYEAAGFTRAQEMARRLLNIISNLRADGRIISRSLMPRLQPLMDDVEPKLTNSVRVAVSYLAFDAATGTKFTSFDRDSIAMLGTNIGSNDAIVGDAEEQVPLEIGKGLYVASAPTVEARSIHPRSKDDKFSTFEMESIEGRPGRTYGSRQRLPLVDTVGSDYSYLTEPTRCAANAKLSSQLEGRYKVLIETDIKQSVKVTEARQVARVLSSTGFRIRGIDVVSEYVFPDGIKIQYCESSKQEREMAAAAAIALQACGYQSELEPGLCAREGRLTVTVGR